MHPPITASQRQTFEYLIDRFTPTARKDDLVRRHTDQRCNLLSRAGYGLTAHITIGVIARRIAKARA